VPTSSNLACLPRKRDAASVFASGVPQTASVYFSTSENGGPNIRIASGSTGSASTPPAGKSVAVSGSVGKLNGAGVH